jgi:tetratricopeptide (TPR) repeat protein
VQKHYVLIGIGVASLVAATVVVIGAGMGGDGATVARDAAAATQPLPSGHPAGNGAGKGATARNPSGVSVQRTITELRIALKAHPQDPKLLLELGDASFLGRRYREAERAFRAVLQLAPDSAAASVRLAMVWQADGDSQRALAALKDVIAAAPADQEAHYYLAIVYFSQKDAVHAKAEWIIAARIDPTSTIGHRSQSFVDLLEGRQTTAPSAGGKE